MAQTANPSASVVRYGGIADPSARCSRWRDRKSFGSVVRDRGTADPLARFFGMAGLQILRLCCFARGALTSPDVQKFMLTVDSRATGDLRRRKAKREDRARGAKSETRP